MKSSFRIIALAASIAALASLSPAMHAQDKLTVSVNVPFSFDCGTKHFAPGVYTLNLDNPSFLDISTGEDRGATIVNTSSEPNLRGGNRVIFHKYGDRYFLAEVVVPDLGHRATVIESDAEKHAIREYREQVKNGSVPTQVALALLPQRALGN
jgi:hypothetical protein